MRNGLMVGVAAGLGFGVLLPGTVWAQAPGTPVAVAAAPGPSSAAVSGVAVDPPGRVGVLAQLSGVVSFHLADAVRWEAASVNLPVTTGGAFWTQPNARAAIDIVGTRLTLDAATELDVLQLDAHVLTASVPQGRIYIRVRVLPEGETEVVQTPRGVVRLLKPGRYEIDAGDATRPTVVAVVDGEADVQPAGVDTQTDGTIVHVGPNQAATITGDGQATPYAVSLGAAARDPFLTAMLAAEAPPRSAAAPAYVARYTGGAALEEYGAWSTVPEYGAVWYPPEASYVPYRRGHWAYVAPWGWTWVDDAPWGFAPSHYGRWLQVSGRWGWLPGAEVPAYPVYAPAVVSFLGGVALGSAIGWVPLGPNEAYYPPYRVNPAYVRTLNQGQINNISVVENTYVNSFNRGAVQPREPFLNRAAATAVPAAAMLGSRNLVGLARPVPVAGVTPIGIRPPLMPGRATVGVTNAVARQFNLPAGPQRPIAPGPVFRAQAASPGGPLPRVEEPRSPTAPLGAAPPGLSLPPGLHFPGGQGGYRPQVGSRPAPASPVQGPGPVVSGPPHPAEQAPIAERPPQREMARPNPQPQRPEQSRPAPQVVRPQAQPMPQPRPEPQRPQNPPPQFQHQERERPPMPAAAPAPRPPGPQQGPRPEQRQAGPPHPEGPHPGGPRPEREEHR